MHLLMLQALCGLALACFIFVGTALAEVQDVVEPLLSELSDPAQFVTGAPASLFTSPVAQQQPPRSAQSDPFHLVWDRLKPAIDKDDFQAVNQGALELETLMLSAGVRSLDEYALIFIAKGEQQLTLGDAETAHFYLRKAYQLSPHSPVVLYRSLYLARETGFRSPIEQWKLIISTALRDPELLFQIPVLAVYPLLWALTFGLFLSFVLFFSLHSDELLRRVARILPKGVRGYLTPVVVLLVIVIPLLLGPLWTLSLWSLLLFACLPRYRSLGMIAGSVVALWGLIIPLKENITLWLKDPGVEVMLRLAVSSHGSQDIQQLEALAVRRLGTDGLVYYLLGDLSRRYGMYSDAERYLTAATSRMSGDPRLSAQLALIRFAQGENEKALELFLKAEAKGLQSASLYYNLSKVQFELLDTKASRESITKARQLDPLSVEQFEEREEALGLRASSSYSGFQIPMTQLVRSALIPMPGAKERYTEVAKQLMWPLAPFGIALVGIAVFLGFFAVSPVRKRRLETYCLTYSIPSAQRRLTSLFPGGAFAVAGRPVWCVFGISLVVLSLFPLIGWPASIVHVFSQLPNASQYAFLVASVIFSVVYVTSFIVQKEGWDSCRPVL